MMKFWCTCERTDVVACEGLALETGLVTQSKKRVSLTAPSLLTYNRQYVHTIHET